MSGKRTRVGSRKCKRTSVFEVIVVIDIKDPAVSDKRYHNFVPRPRRMFLVFCTKGKRERKRVVVSYPNKQRGRKRKEEDVQGGAGKVPKQNCEGKRKKKRRQGGSEDDLSHDPALPIAA